MNRHKSSAELLEISIRGMLADAFRLRGVEPDEQQWRLLRGEDEVTARSARAKRRTGR